MSQKGFLKIQFLSIQGLKSKQQQCMIKVKAVDTIVSAKLSQEKLDASPQFFIPITQKIQIQLHSSLPNIGFFELPIKKIYEYPTKKHIITINCVTKDPIKNEINPDVSGVLKIALLFFENHISKLDILIDRLHLTQEKNQGKEREIYVECMVGNVSSQTTLKKANEGGNVYEWKQVLPFSLESIPGKIQLAIKDKEMHNDENLGKISIDPQNEAFFETTNNKQQRRYEILAQGRKIELFLSKLFKIPENQ